METIEKHLYNPETKELFCKGKDYKPYNGGLGKLIFHRLTDHANSSEELIAHIDTDTGNQKNYKDFRSDSIKLAQYMKSIGIQPGDNISMCSYNHFNCEMVMVAAQFIGAVLGSTDPILSLKDTKYLLDMIKPKVIFVSEGSEDLIRAASEAIQLNCKLITFATKCIEGFELFEDIMKPVILDETFEPFYVNDLDSTCAIAFSSGTTGMPKGICLSHNHLISCINGYQSVVLKWIMLQYASAYWTTWIMHLFFSINLGNTRLLCKEFKKELHWEIMSKYNVVHLMCSYTFTMDSYQYLKEDMHFPSFESMSVVGGLIPENILTGYIKKLPNVTVGYGYGSTECGGISYYAKGNNQLSAGKPICNNQIIKIVDPNTEEALPLNKVGEIRVKHKQQMTGYYNADSSEIWDTDGFLKTGDLGYLDDEFNLFVVDRIKEMFKYGSWHVVPAKIENLLSTHPDVQYAVALGKPTGTSDGSHAMAVVCLHEGSDATAEEIEAFANEQLDSINKIRAGVVIVDKRSFQFTPTGKINRRALKEMFGLVKTNISVVVQ